MLANSSDKHGVQPKKRYQWWLALLLVVWVLAGYIFAQALLIGVTWLLTTFGVSLGGVSQAVINALFAAAVYVLSLAIVLGVPWLVKRRRVNRQDLGLARLPSWLDIGLAPAGLVVYLVGSVVLLAAISALIPGLDMDQIQENGFENIGQRYEYVLAFATLVVVAPVAEEVLFRGYLYGKVRTKVPIWAAIIFISALFALVHGQWNVAVDVFALSIVLCILREITGSIWSGILLHMIKNGVAFYFLFINPMIV